MPLAGRWVRGKEWPPSWATRDKSIPVRSISHRTASADEAASSPMSPPAERLADRAVSAANASTESPGSVPEERTALMPDEALAELPPVRRSLSISTTLAPASRRRSAADSPATPVPITSASGIAGVWSTGAARAGGPPPPPSSASGEAGAARAAPRCCAKRGEAPKCLAISSTLLSRIRMRETACASAAGSSAPDRPSAASAPSAVSIRSVNLAGATASVIDEVPGQWSLLTPGPAPNGDPEAAAVAEVLVVGGTQRASIEAAAAPAPEAPPPVGAEPPSSGGISAARRMK
mmetsp:Transcript_2001/g.6647  ORF Transcript_2001/g.6647 Transcript_2001/m.6647 type:complete len:292 (-) Transcript_2001:1438-2313(-)|eukprot:scaffold1228_cov115-Isochrysis_galbana.AAC.18